MSALPPKADIGTGPRMPAYYLRRSSGSLAMFAAIRRASSLPMACKAAGVPEDVRVECGF
jgi:hypothetical protein